MKTIQQLLDAKGTQVWRIDPEASVFDAIGLMADKGVGALLVLEEDKTVGIFTERDYARNVALKGRSSSQTAVREVMTTQVICARPSQTNEECMALMTEKRVRHLPVIEGEQLLGIISIGDLVKDIIAEQKFVIEQLEHYIVG